MIKSPSSKWVIALGLIVLLAIGVWGVLFLFIQQDKKIVIEINQKSEQSGGGEGVVGLRLNQEKITKIKNYFISGESTVKLLEELEQLGRKTNVNLTIGQAGEAETELKLNLSTEGTFSGTMKFLQGLENLPYATRIDRLELKKSEKMWQSVFILRVLKDNTSI